MAKLTDYKFWYIIRDDNGFIIEAAVNFSEGEMMDVEELDMLTEETVVNNRYVRTKRLGKLDMPHLSDKFKNDKEGYDSKVYLVEDFGQIKTNDELRVYLNGELKNDATRTPVEEQNTLDINKVK